MDSSLEIDIKYLKRTLELAEEGRGLVSPGPLVGCVVLDSEGEVVGEGAYFFKDVVHAEIVALSKAGERARGGTAYVSLEPHSHHGKTPPCTEALLNAGIKRVVVPTEDPNPLVAGKGFEYLRANGVEVETGGLRDEARRQNEQFVIWHTKKRPFFHLKLAISLDGRIATKTNDSKWITGSASRKRGQQLRSHSDAILVGSNTIKEDDPSLSDRSGHERVRDLIRILLDSSCSVGSDMKAVNGDFPSLIFCREGVSHKSAYHQGVEVICSTEGPRDLSYVAEQLYQRSIQRVLIEGGGEVAAAFLEAGLIDKVSFFIAPRIIGGRDAVASIGGNGIADLADAWNLEDVEVSRCGDDIEVTGYPRRSTD